MLRRFRHVPTSYPGKSEALYLIIRRETRPRAFVSSSELICVLPSISIVRARARASDTQAYKREEIKEVSLLSGNVPRIARART